MELPSLDGVAASLHCLRRPGDCGLSAAEDSNLQDTFQMLTL